MTVPVVSSAAPTHTRYTIGIVSTLIFKLSGKDSIPIKAFNNELYNESVATICK